MRSKKVVWLVKMALLTALSLVLMYLVRFPIFPAAAYLEYDMADVPILIGTFMYGPGAGLLLTGVVSLLQWLLVSPQSGWVGGLMHFLATGGFVLVAGFLYQHKHTRKGAVLSLLLGTLTTGGGLSPAFLLPPHIRDKLEKEPFIYREILLFCLIAIAILLIAGGWPLCMVPCLRADRPR